MNANAFIPLSVLSLLLAAPTAASAGEVETYWAPAQGLHGDALRDAVHDIISGHEVIPYDSSSFDTHDAIDLLDEDPSDPDAVELLYSTATADKDTWPGYSREHAWPRSLGTGEGSPAYSDLHHIFSCDANVNSARSNKPYGDCVEGCQTHPEAPDAPFNEALFEAPDYEKGDIARALFYMDVRYEGDGGEPDLHLTDGLVTTGCDCMGDLSTLLAWSALDPVDAAERARNDGVYELQGNRNPFVDHPEWVCELWASEACGDPVEPPSGALWFNEVHYDNAGADVGEGFEIAGPAGADLGGWAALLYNGNGGGVYATVNLSGILPDQEGGYGTLWFAKGLQNGPIDGMALVSPEGEVVSFISYEGALVATSGAAAGLGARDIGVAEGSDTPVGASLGLVGAGTAATMGWVGPSAASPGAPNPGQILGDGSAPQGPDLWLSEVHYDNAGADVGEGFEVSGVAGAALTGYLVVLYNGNDSGTYGQVALSGTIPNQGGGRGALWFARPGLQNGLRDGLALVDPDGGVLELWSYEGVVRPNEGPAAGMTSVDMGVNEGATTPSGLSLQRVDVGLASEGWIGPVAASPGALND